MLLKRKIYKTTAMALAVISIFGSSLTHVSAYDGDTNIKPIAQFSDGIYELNTTLKNLSDENKDSMANGYLQSSKLEIRDGKQYMRLEFASGNMIKEATAKVDGKDIEVKNTLNGDIRTVEFEVPSIDSNIVLGVKINPFGDFVVDANCIVKSDFKTQPPVLPEVPETPEVPEQPEVPSTPETPENPEQPETPSKPETPGNPEQPQQPEVPSKPDNKPSTDNQDGKYKNGFYELKNTVKCDNPTGYAMVRNLLNENTVMEVKDSKTYITFEMSGYDMMGDVKIKVDGKNVNFTKTDLGNNNVKFKVEVPSVDSNISMKIFVKAMNKDVEFGIGLEKSTIKFVSSNEEPTIPNNPSSNNANTGSTGNSTNNNSDNSSNKSENVAGNATVKGKLYTIKNEIIEDNPTGKEMARKYLNETSKIEEENGKTYATLTFTGVDLMKDHKIYVNGSKVNHQIVSKDSNSISIRFEIPNVDADIKVELFVIPMGSNIDFGVKLLKDTLTFVKDYESNSNKLPQTGSLLNGDAMLMAGSMATIGGLTIGRKKRK